MPEPATAFLDEFTGWRDAAALVITTWDAKTFPGSYNTAEARDAEGVTIWSVPSVKFYEGSNADLTRLLTEGLPGMTVAAYPSSREFWGENQISGGLGGCTEIWITGGPWKEQS